MLYPLLGIAFNAKSKPSNTYIDQGKDGNSCFLLCVYETDYLDNEFYIFRNDVLMKHPLFSNLKVTIGKNILIFDLKSDFEQDFKFFLQGKYSKFSIRAKELIKDYYSNSDVATVMIDSHINPKPYHKAYADFLECSEELIENNFETLNPPDLLKEKLVYVSPMA